MTFTQADLLQNMEDCYNYFLNNRGDSKPNACNLEGIPYHAYETGYHWQIHEGSTTSECIGIMIRAMVESGYLEYAKQLADYAIDILSYDDVETVHWLVNLYNNGADMDTAVCGAYDGAIFSFTNGVGFIPAGSPWHGDKVLPRIDNRYYGVINCYSETATFQYKDLWIEPHTGTTYSVASYVTTPSGTTITLNNTTVTGNLQVYYGYKNGKILNKNDIYRSYPLNMSCFKDFVPDDILTLNDAGDEVWINKRNDILILSHDESDYEYQLSAATDAIQWVIISLNKLASAVSSTDIVAGLVALDNANTHIAINYIDTVEYTEQQFSSTYYKNKADALLLKLRTDSLVKTSDYSIFDATNRGLSWWYLYSYDEFENRTITFDKLDKSHMRIAYKAGTGGVAQWGIGHPFEWYSDDVLIGFTGDGSNALRNFVINDGTTSFYYPFLDKPGLGEQELVIQRSGFSDTKNLFLNASRIPFLDPYTWGMWNGYSHYSVVENPETNYKDSENLVHPLVHKWDFECDGGQTACAFGTSPIAGVVTDSNTIMTFIVRGANLYKEGSVYYDGNWGGTRANWVPGCTMKYKVIDANGTQHVGNKWLDFSENTAEYKIGFTDSYFDSSASIVHPIANVEIYMDNQTFITDEYGSLGYTDRFRKGTLYFYAIKVGSKSQPASPIEVFAIETRDTRAGYFDISHITIEQGNADIYPYSGVAVFSLEYSDIGLLGWRSGSYQGYTNPYTFLGGSNDAIYASKFIYDAQSEFRQEFKINGPSYPVFLRNLGENLVYGALQTWTFEGPDPNTTWAGFQYRALENQADHYYYHRATLSANELGYCRGFLNNWCNYLYRYILTNDRIPSTISALGVVTSEYESPDFYAQVGRGMLLKHVRDWDTRSWYIVNWCYTKLIALQQTNGSFKAEGADTYNFHTAEALLFFAELYALYDEYKYTTGMTEFTWLPKKVYTASIEFRTQIFQAYSGKEVRTSETKYPMRKWRLKFDKDNTDLVAIRTYINSLQGRYSRFNWVWPTTHGGDGRTYICRLSADNMVTNMQHLGYASFELVFEAIDENAYTDLTTFTEAHNVEYEQQEQHSTQIDETMCANMAVNVQWESPRKRWNLQFEKNKVSRQWLENFFISKKGKFKEWTFVWSADLGGDGNSYQVRFDIDTLDFDISYLGFGTFTIPIIEVL